MSKQLSKIFLSKIFPDLRLVSVMFPENIAHSRTNEMINGVCCQIEIKLLIFTRGCLKTLNNLSQSNHQGWISGLCVNFINKPRVSENLKRNSRISNLLNLVNAILLRILPSKDP